mmetsp:Transcript_51555/g.103539  ORF Transcript_51555/g.103539 Transcript_51555/m.103539 type:complete len:203 (-) Transcript_51555:312-920(-)
MQTLIFPLFAFSLAVERASAFQIASGSTPHGHVSHLHLQTRRMGMFDGWKGKGGGDKKGKDDWKEADFKAQQEIIRKRKANQGFLSEEDKGEISKRQLKAKQEYNAGGGADQACRTGSEGPSSEPADKKPSSSSIVAEVASSERADNKPSSSPIVAEKSSSPPIVAASQDLDEWVTAVDEASGNTYYYSTVTGETSWDPPSK